MSYTVRAKIVSLIGTIDGSWNVVFQRIDSIEDKRNPFHGQKKMAVLKITPAFAKDLAKLLGATSYRDLIEKQVILKMKDDGTIFEKVLGIAKDDVIGFRAIPQHLPKFVVRDSDGREALGVMYK